MDDRSSPVGGFLTEPVLVVRQQPHKGQRPEYEVFDGRGDLAARCVYVPDSEVEPLLRALGLRRSTAAALRIVDPGGALVFTVVFPGWRGRAVVLIRDAEGREVGEAIKTRGFFRLRYELRHGKRQIGTIQVTDQRQRSVTVTDETGSQVATLRTITKDSPYAGADERDGHSVHVPTPLAEPLRSVAVASALVFQAVAGSESAVGETTVLQLSFIPRWLDPLRRG
jgi:hypothetical protein